MNAAVTVTSADTQQQAAVRQTAPFKPGVSTTVGQPVVEVLTEGDSAVLALRRAIRRILERASEPCPELAPALSEVLTGVGDMASRRALGSFASERWQLNSGAILHEILVSGRHLSSDADEVAHTLIHELAHLLAHVRGIRDCSNRGRYHNRKFKDCAEELGLIVDRGDRYGYFTRGLSCQLRERLAPELHGLRGAMTIQLNNPSVDEIVIAEEPRTVQRKYVSAICQCIPPRIIRVTLGHWMAETIGCFLCRSFFFDTEAADVHASEAQRRETIAVGSASTPVIPRRDRDGLPG